MMRRRTTLGLVMVIGGACTGLEPRAVPDPRMVLYRLGDVPVVAVEGEAAPLSIGVRPFTAVPELAGDALVAFTSPVEVQRAVYHAWVSGLRAVVTDASIRSLQATGAFEHVGHASAMPHAAAYLQGHLLGFHEEDTPEGVFAVVRVTFELVSADTHRSFGQPVTVEASRVVAAEDPDDRWTALVAGLGEALGESISRAAPILRGQLGK